MSRGRPSSRDPSPPTFGSARKSGRASSVRPDPTRPAIPSTRPCGAGSLHRFHLSSAVRYSVDLQDHRPGDAVGIVLFL